MGGAEEGDNRGDVVGGGGAERVSWRGFSIEGASVETERVSWMGLRRRICGT